MNIGRKSLMLSLKFVRRLVIGVVGFTILLIGIALIVLPGPAFVVIPLGLAILATEFVWARTLLQKARAKLVRRGKQPPANPVNPKTLLCLGMCATMLMELF
jgi:uncharacterized protein (TIGR02611 family)